MQSPKLSLYQFDSCPFCARVNSAIARLGIEVELRNIRENEQHRQDLIEATGRQTVPVLRIEEAGGRVCWMPESADIIAYLEKHFSS